MKERSCINCGSCMMGGLMLDCVKKRKEEKKG